MPGRGRLHLEFHGGRADADGKRVQNPALPDDGARGPRHYAPVAKRFHRAFTCPNLHFAVADCIRSELNSQNGGGSEALDALIFHIHGPVVRLLLRIGCPAASKGAQGIQDDDHNEYNPHRALKTPPAVLKTEIGPDCNFVVYFRNVIGDRVGGWVVSVA